MNCPVELRHVGGTAALHLLVDEVSRATSSAWGWSEEGLAVRVLRGWKMRSRSGFMDEVGAALQFPYYFGENWAAFDECLSDMEWISAGEGIIIVVLEAGSVLIDEGPRELETLVAMFKKSIVSYGLPVDDGESWDRPALPFNVVLQASESAEGDVVQRWEFAGARVVRMQ